MEKIENRNAELEAFQRVSLLRAFVGVKSNRCLGRYNYASYSRGIACPLPYNSSHKKVTLLLQGRSGQTWDLSNLESCRSLVSRTAGRPRRQQRRTWIGPHRMSHRWHMTQHCVRWCKSISCHVTCRSAATIGQEANVLSHGRPEKLSDSG